MKRLVALTLAALTFPASALALGPGDKVSYVAGTTARTGTLLVQTPTVDLIARDPIPGTTQDNVDPAVVRAVATPTPTPTTTPTNTATPTPTPTSTPSTFPDATNTGVPFGTPLTAYTGPDTISTPNTVIDSKIMGCIRVTAPGVIIKNSQIRCDGVVGDAVASYDGDYTGTPLLIEDSEIACSTGGVGSSGPGTALGDTNITGLRLNIYGCENGLDIDANVDLEDSYVHDMFNSAEAHTDGAQFGSGHYDANHNLVTGVLNVTLKHNTIFGMGADGSFGTSAIISGPRNDTNVLIQNNLLGGGAYTLYCENGSTGINYRVLGNHFTTRFKSTVGFYGPSDQCADDQQSGNMIDETGAPLTLG